MLDDHLPCPALWRWLPQRLVEPVGVWVSPEIHPRGGLRRIISPWIATAQDDGPLRSLVVVSSLHATPASLPTATVDRVDVGGMLVELARPKRPGLSTVWRPSHRRREAMHAAAERVRHWLERGVIDLEQWIALEPRDTVVTMGVRGVGPR